MAIAIISGAESRASKIDDFNYDVHYMAQRARALICIMEDLADVAGDDDPNHPNSDTQKRYACLGSLRWHIDALANAAEAADQPAAKPAQAEPDDSPARDRAQLTRSAAGHLLMASLELHTATCRIDAVHILTEKALKAIGKLRDMTNGGRVQP